MGGRLKKYYKEWQRITSDKFILETVSGYKIPFTGPVSQSSVPTVKFSSLAEEKVCATAIDKLLSKGAIRLCRPEPGQFISTYFTLPKPDGSVRFIFNLQKLNAFIMTAHFKMEDIRTARRLISKNCYMASIDLEDAYLTVPINAKYTKYLRFIFRGVLYEFIVLPFGLCTAPYVFTKIMKPIVCKLREKGYTSVLYIDDMLVVERTLEKCLENINESIKLMNKLGFLINWKKSVLTPSNRCKFLGFTLVSTTLLIELTEGKRASIVELINSIMKKDHCKIVDFASLIGKLVAACPAVNYGYVYTKILEREKTAALEKSGNNYEFSMKISDEVKKDLRWWINTIPKATSPLTRSKFTVTIFTDASKSGWGGTCGQEKVYGYWNDNQKNHHINYLELLAIKLALLGLANNIKNSNILLRVDNTTALAYINKMGGTQFPKLNSLARQIWQWAETRNNFLFASYIKSSENVEADYLSRIANLDTEWTVATQAFKDIVSFFGRQPEIDLFASLGNTKCSVYISRFPEKEAVEVDAFTVDWSKWYFYAFPPFALVLRTLEKIIDDNASGILIVPNWPNQPWYPLFMSLLIGEPRNITNENISLPYDSRIQCNIQPKWSLVAGNVSGRHFEDNSTHLRQ